MLRPAAKRLARLVHYQHDGPRPSALPKRPAPKHVPMNTHKLGSIALTVMGMTRWRRR